VTIPSHDDSPLVLLHHEDLRDHIDSVVTQWVAEHRSITSDRNSAAADLVNAAEKLLTGGKRMRPALAYWAWRAHGGSISNSEHTAVITAGAALELFQAAALVHDDVMDDSDTRRGLPSAHRAFAAQHRQNNLSGSADEFGTSAAILLGDLLLIGSEELFARALEYLPDNRRYLSRSVFSSLRTDVTYGQYLDVLTQVLPWGENPNAELQRAREVVREKSARYSVEQPLMLGAALAGGTTTDVENMSEFGLPLGEAFQLRDDLLDVFGDSDTLGKPAGADLREGKRTVLATIAIAKAAHSHRNQLLQQLGNPHLSDADINKLRNILTRSGAVTEVEELIEELSQQAFSHLHELHLASPGKEMLDRLANALVYRNF